MYSSLLKVVKHRWKNTIEPLYVLYHFSSKGRKLANLIADNLPMFVAKTDVLVQQTRLGECPKGARAV
jgi:hypothetical protein